MHVVYTNQKNAWVDAALFTNWFHKLFVPTVQAWLKEMGLEPKAVLNMLTVSKMMAASWNEIKEQTSGSHRERFSVWRIMMKNANKTTRNLIQTLLQLSSTHIFRVLEKIWKRMTLGSDCKLMQMTMVILTEWC